MEVVQVQRLYRRRHSREAVLVLTGCQSGDEISLAIPACQAAPLALGRTDYTSAVGCISCSWQA